MKKEHAEFVLQAGIGKLYDDEHDSYSGRGMFGSRTSAVEVEAWEIHEADKAISVGLKREEDPEQFDEYTDDEIIEELVDAGEFEKGSYNNFRVDNLGMDYIIY
jgi:hypothetical protein